MLKNNNEASSSMTGNV